MGKIAHTGGKKSKKPFVVRYFVKVEFDPKRSEGEIDVGGHQTRKVCCGRRSHDVVSLWREDRLGRILDWRLAIDLQDVENLETESAVVNPRSFFQGVYKLYLDF